MVLQRIEEIREEIAALASQLEDEQDRLSRLTITRETVEEILGDAALAVTTERKILIAAAKPSPPAAR